MVVMIWFMLHPTAEMDVLGLIPSMLDDDDPRPADEQIEANYQHGGGWCPQSGFKLLSNGSLSYPGDPPFPVIAMTILHAFTDKPEEIRFYQYDFVAIVQADGSYEVSRID
jgi:hypothetical protein